MGHTANMQPTRAPNQPSFFSSYRQFFSPVRPRYDFAGASPFIDFMKRERPVAASTISYIASTPIEVPLASLIGAFPTRTQHVSPLPDSCRSMMSRR